MAKFKSRIAYSHIAGNATDAFRTFNLIAKFDINAVRKIDCTRSQWPYDNLFVCKIFQSR